MEHYDPVIQLDRRSRGLSYNLDAVRRAYSDGLGGGYREQTVAKYEFPNYDGTDNYDQRGEYQPQPEIVTDPKTMLEWLTIAGQRVTHLQELQEQSKLRKEDFDPELIEIVETIAVAEHDLNDKLRDENPNWTAAIDKWLEHDLAVSLSGSHADKAAFFEDLVADVATEKRGYEEELYFWTQFNENKKRQTELSEGLAYYEGLLEVTNHRRIEELAHMNREELQRLYALAA